MSSNGDDYPDINEGGGVVRLKKKGQKTPRIKWGRKYLEWSDVRKVVYLEKLASSLNWAAGQIEKERDELIRIAKGQEQQIVQLQERLAAQIELLQKRLLRFNEQKQGYIEENQELKSRLREFEHGDFNRLGDQGDQRSPG